MKSPSMQITDVDNNGAVLIYRSSRSGFSKYLMGRIRFKHGKQLAFNPTLNAITDFSFPKLGQLLEIANEIYGLDLKVRILEAENDINGGTTGPINLDTGLKSVVVKYRLDFDNSEYVMSFEVSPQRSSNSNQIFPLKLLHVVHPDEPSFYHTISHSLCKIT
jgi:guanylate cyclase, other